jgi:hypothetical protein
MERRDKSFVTLTPDEDEDEDNARISWNEDWLFLLLSADGDRWKLDALRDYLRREW